MKRFLFGIALMLTTPVMADLQADMLQDRLDRLDREMTLLQKKVYSPATTQAATTKAAESQTGTLNELYSQLDEQNQIIADLTKKVEELTHEQAVLREDLNKLNADTQLQFQELKKNPEAEKNEPPKSDKEAYDEAYNLLMKSKYPEAEQAFTAFLKNYSDSKLVGNANYWLGETYYVRGQYDVAAGVFSDGLTKYEKSTKAPDNLLKLALTMAKLDKKTEACEFLNLLPEKFSGADKALKQRAVQEAKKLSCP